MTAEEKKAQRDAVNAEKAKKKAEAAAKKAAKLAGEGDEQPQKQGDAEKKDKVKEKPKADQKPIEPQKLKSATEMSNGANQRNPSILTQQIESQLSGNQQSNLSMNRRLSL